MRTMMRRASRRPAGASGERMAREGRTGRGREEERRLRDRRARRRRRRMGAAERTRRRSGLSCVSPSLLSLRLGLTSFGFSQDFTRHSLDRKPYNPRNVQHYSRSAKTWYEVRELKENNHVRRAPAPDPVKPATTKESSSHARLSPSLGEYFPPSQSKATASSSSSADDLVQRLTALSTQPTVRGGAYGLIGNSYLVVRATELLSLLSPSSSSNSSSSSSSPSFSPVDPAATRAEASMLLSSFSKWERLVQDRVDGVRDGNGLAKEWRGREEAGEGKRWVCPVSREVI